MSTEENKAALRRIPEEVINTGNLDLADELFAPDYIEHVPIPPGMPTGVEGFKAYFAMLRAAFPDLHYTVEAVLAEGDMTACHIVARGTHQGEFMGIPAMGRQVTWTETHIGRYEGGKLVEHWGDSHNLGLTQQLGVAPSRSRPGHRLALKTQGDRDMRFLVQMGGNDTVDGREADRQLRDTVGPQLQRVMDSGKVAEAGFLTDRRGHSS